MLHSTSLDPNGMPLKGRLILDCSALLPGPFLGKLMALKGARVIKIENPRKPDRAKSMGVVYNDLNDLKEIRMLDLTQAEDRGKFHDLVRQADGLIEAFRPQTKAKLGLDEATLLGVNPKLCIASLVGFPEDGPWRDRAGHDLNFSALTGCVSLFHEMPALPLADLFSAYEGALALTAAMDGVSRGDSGKRLVVSMVDTLKNIQSHLVREYETDGKVPTPGGTLFSGLYPCYRLYTAKDGRRVAVGAIEEKFWKKVCELLNLGQLAGEGYSVGEKGQAVIRQVQEVFSAHPWKGHWENIFGDADCCVEPVLDYSEVFSRGV